MKLTSLHEDAKKLLRLSAEILAENGVDVPTNQYVAGGTLAWDMPSLTVYAGPVYLGNPGQPQISSAFPDAIRWVAPFYIQILRNSEAVMPGMKAARSPSVKDLDAEGKVMTDDLTALGRLVMFIRGNNLMVPRSSPVGIGSITPLGPEGSMVGARAEMHFTLEG